LVVRESVRHLVEPSGGHRKDVGHPTFSVATTEELQVLTKVLVSMPTWLAVAAHQRRLNRNPVADHDIAYSIGEGDHHTDHFMARIVRRFHEDVLTVSAGLVRAAHPRHRHFDEGLSGLEGRHRLRDHLDDVGGAHDDAAPLQLLVHYISSLCV
jgi:hypothetical protein